MTKLLYAVVFVSAVVPAAFGDGGTRGSALPRLTPRGSDLVVYPAPAVKSEAGILGPYGPGLAAAAPIGTPYLRSPAFAGPPIIYMPQTVTRVLVPGSTPYPSQIMQPPVRYVYSSAPFTRTDIYVDLPYGTFYWPQGYAGTTPVEPQVPAYVVSPSTALMTNEASYAVQRYAPGTASAETLNPISAATDASALAAPAPSSMTLSTAMPGLAPAPANATMMVPPAPAPTPAPLQPLAPFPSSTEPVVPPAPMVPPAPSMPSLSSAPAPDMTSPFSPDATKIMASTPSPNADKPGIIVDDKSADGLALEPRSGWENSVNFTDSYEQSSLVAKADGKVKTATFKADIPEDGQYEVFVWYVASNKEFRSSAVPVTVFAADGPQKLTIDQTRNNRQFNSLGTFNFKAGQKVPVVMISTEGISPNPTMSVSVDAIKLVKAAK